MIRHVAPGSLVDPGVSLCVAGRASSASSRTRAKQQMTTDAARFTHSQTRNVLSLEEHLYAAVGDAHPLKHGGEVFPADRVAAAGGVLGNMLGKGDSKLLTTIVGGAAGGLLGREIDRGNVKCR